MYNRLVCRALDEIGEAGKTIEKRVLIATDHESDVSGPAAEFSTVTLEACGGKRLRFIGRAIGLALRHHVDVMLIGHVNYASLGLLVKCLRPGMRYGVIVYGIDVWTRLSMVKRRALRGADFIGSISEYTKQKVVEVQGVAPNRVHVLSNTIEWLRPHRETSARDHTEIRALPEGPRLLSVCRLDERERYKGVDTMISALPAVIERVPDVQYVVVGSGSDLDRHKLLAEQLGVGGQVHFVGSVDEATLQHHYRECDVFALPSDGEGFGIVYLEAMYYGKPVIAANSRAVPEVVKHDETGLLIEYGQIDRLAEALVTLCIDPAMRERMGRAGRKLLQEKFTFERFKRELHELILESAPPGLPSDSHPIARGMVSADL